MRIGHVPLLEQRKAVVRELALRQRVYPKWTESGRMTADEAAFQLAAMQSVLDTLDRVEDMLIALKHVVRVAKPLSSTTALDEAIHSAETAIKKMERAKS